MPNCAIKGCKNHTTKNKKEDGITYHKLPIRDQDEDMREKWIEIIRVSRNEPLWYPKLSTVVCSAHFEKADLYDTKKGYRRVLRNGYPKISVPVLPERLYNTEVSQPPNVHQPAVPNQSDDLGSSQPSTLYNKQPGLMVQSCLDLIQPAAYRHQLGVAHQSYDLHISQQFPTCPLFAEPIKSEQVSEQVMPIFDNRETYKLRKRVSVLETKLELNKKKVKTLNQKVRRLMRRNKSLRKILINLKKRKIMSNSE